MSARDIASWAGTGKDEQESPGAPDRNTGQEQDGRNRERKRQRKPKRKKNMAPIRLAMPDARAECEKIVPRTQVSWRPGGGKGEQV